MKLYQKTKLGKTKFLEIRTEGPNLITEWGLLGSKKVQKTVKKCKGMNKGRANATTPDKQALLEKQAKIELKMKEGYLKTKPSDTDTIVGTGEIDLDNIPKELCPNKPISEAPESILKNPLTYAQRKHDGHCIILVKGKKTERIFSRRMEDRTSYLKDIPVIKDVMSKLPKNSFVLTEVVYEVLVNGIKKEIPRFAAQVVTVQNAGQAYNRFVELSKTGTFSCIPFDALWFDSAFIGNTCYLDRRNLLVKAGLKVPVLYTSWTIHQDTLLNLGQTWEGFILRVPGEKSYIGYTMDGTAHRHGSYKWKFLKTDDFVVDEVLKGKSGKHADFYAKFHVIQYDSAGNVLDRGYVGCGTLSHDELKQLTKDIDSKKRKVPFVVEIEYQALHDETGKLQFGQIQRLRDDKKPSECIYEG